MAYTVLVLETESLEYYPIVIETGGHDITVATEIPFKKTLLHDDFENIPFLHIVHEVDLMAEHVGKLEG